MIEAIKTPVAIPFQYFDSEGILNVLDYVENPLLKYSHYLVTGVIYENGSIERRQFITTILKAECDQMTQHGILTRIIPLQYRLMKEVREGKGGEIV